MKLTLKSLAIGLGFAALAAAPVMAKTHAHRGPNVVYPTFPKTSPIAPGGHDWQLEGRLPVPDKFVPYYDGR